jgi:hypothetical protein
VFGVRLQARDTPADLGSGYPRAQNGMGEALPSWSQGRKSNRARSLGNRMAPEAAAVWRELTPFDFRH